MPGKKNRALSDPYSQLTWEALEQSFGKRILGRGERYQQSGRVTDLALYAQNGLVARVAGSEAYVCRVLASDGGKLQTLCTCPYGEGCKHAVAVVLEYLECLKKKCEVKLIQNPEADARLVELEEGLLEDDEDMEDPPVDDFVAARKSASLELEKFLSGKTKPQLVSICVEMSGAVPEARQWLQDQQSLAARKPSKFVKTIRSELAALEDTQWDRHGYGGHSANLTRLKSQLQALVDLKEYAILIELGAELLSAGNEAVQHEHESESFYELSECLDLIFDVLPRSSLGDAEQLLWVIDLGLQDDYGLCGDAVGEFLDRKYSQSAWSAVADKLKARLSAMPVPDGTSDYSQTYQRRRVSGHLASALQQAGRCKELTAHYLSEAKAAGNYNELVNHLMEQKQWGEAKKHCIAGIKASAKQSSFAHVGRLYELLDRIYLSTKNRSQQAALAADSFLSRPQIDRYRELLKASKALKVSPAVDAWVRHFLETGEEPGESAKGKGKQTKLPTWPLEKLEAPEQGRGTFRRFPMFDALIDIAILEKKPDEVLRWYDAQKTGGLKSYGHVGRSQEVAEAVQAAYPERSIEIWKQLAEGNINQVNVKGYEAAVPYLKKIRSCMERHGMGGQWQSYLQQLCDQNRRRPRCVQILKRLEKAGQPIVSL